MELKHPLSLTNHRQIGADLDDAEAALNAARMRICELPATHPARKRLQDTLVMLLTLRGRMRTQLKDDGHIAEWLSGDIYGPSGVF